MHKATRTRDGSVVTRKVHWQVVYTSAVVYTLPTALTLNLNPTLLTKTPRYNTDITVSYELGPRMAMSPPCRRVCFVMFICLSNISDFIVLREPNSPNLG